MLALIGKKIGMMQVFDDKGVLTPVSVIKIEDNVVIGHRTEKKNGYEAIVIGAVAKKKSRITKPYGGQFKEGIQPTQYLKEFKGYEKECQVGEKLGVELFNGVKFVDVSGISKGKGYQGVIKRHGFGGGRKTHGSKFHRAPGSTGNAADPSRVFKGRKMAGRMGHDKTTIQNLRLVKVDQEKKVLLVKGAVPGCRSGMVIVTTAKKM